MIYLKKFDSHSSYDTEINGGGVDISLPNVSYCNDVKDVHYTPYNLVRFYVGDITGTTPQTVSIYTDESTSVDFQVSKGNRWSTDSSTSIPVQVSKGNKWYSYVLPKDKGLCKIKGDSVKKVVVKADMANYNVDNTNGLFPSSIIEASFKGSNTSNVTYMNYMFYGCRSISSLDVSSFDTSNVIDMNSMFQFCTSLKSLDLSSFNTSKVTSMYDMFYNCSSLSSLDVSNFNTSNVTNMSEMFSNCSSLKSLDLSNFNTSNVNDMSNMFINCSSLTSLDLSKWDMSRVTDISSMFDGCSKLGSIRMKGCNQTTIDNITAVKPSGASISTV